MNTTNKSEEIVLHLLRTVEFYERQVAELNAQLIEARKKIADYESLNEAPKLRKIGETISLTN